MRSQGRAFGILGITLLNIAIVYAQSQPIAKPSPTPKSLEHEFFKNILSGQKAIWTSPFRLERHDAKWLVPSALGFGALLTTDRITGDEIAESDRQVTASRYVSYMGSLYGLGAFAGTFYLVGREQKNERARETGLLSAEALVDSVIVGGALKGISQRGRPSTGQERSEFFEGGSSFPSGHSIQVWSVATLVAHEYHDSRAIQIAAYSIASAVSVARFTVQKHYLSDVVVGSALGFGIGRYVYHSRHRMISNDSDVTEQLNHKARPAIAPLYNRRIGQYGVAMTWNF